MTRDGTLECGGSTPLSFFFGRVDRSRKERKRCQATALQSTVAFIAIFCLTSPLIAQEPAKPKVLVSPFGVEIFARLLDQLGMKPVTSLKQLGGEVPLSKCVVIILGNAKPLDTLTEQPFGLTVDRLIDGGASLLVATDRDLNLHRAGSKNVVVRPKTMVNSDPAKAFGDRMCPWIEHGIWPHPIFRDLDDLPSPLLNRPSRAVASNCPAKFEDPPLEGQSLHPVGWLPLGTVRQEPWGENPWRNGRRDRGFFGPGDNGPAYAIATPAGAQDRIVILAGHGVFMNCMTIRDDIGNRRFAENILSWLKEDRTHVLFYHENVLRTNFKLPLVGDSPDLPMPPITVDIIERMLGAIQDEGLPQRLVDRAVAPALILRVALILATIAAFLYGLKKLLGVRLLRPQPGTPYLLGVQPVPHRSLVLERMHEMTVRRRLDEPARALTSSWFRDVAGVDPQRGGRLSYELRTGLLEKRRLGKQLVEMWHLATGVDRTHVDRKRLLEIAESLEALGNSLRRGELTILP
jgi:hypothetical protein